MWIIDGNWPISMATFHGYLWCLSWSWWSLGMTVVKWTVLNGWKLMIINLTGWTGMNIIYYIYTLIYYIYIYTCRIWPIYQLRIAMKSCNISWENSGWTDPSPFPGFHGFRWVRRHVWSCQKVAVRRSIAATKARRVHGIAGDFVTERMCQWQLASWGFGDLYNQQKWSNNVIWPLEMGI